MILYYIIICTNQGTQQGVMLVLTCAHCVTGLVVVVFCCLLNGCDDCPDWQENLRLDQLLEDGLAVPVPAGGVANCLLQLFLRLIGIGYTAHLCVHGGRREGGRELTLYLQQHLHSMHTKLAGMAISILLLKGLLIPA